MAAELAAILPLPADCADAAFSPLAGESPLLRVARTMLGSAVVAAAEPLADRVRETLVGQGLSTVRVVAVAGPGSLAQCLAAALRSFEDPPRHVVRYDVRRPLAPEGLRDRVIEALRAGSPIAMPLLPVTDSVKAVDSVGAVVATLDRSELRTVQAPRGFAADTLSRLLAGCGSDDFDELGEALSFGIPITFVDGDADAFAVELPRDTDYVEAIIAER
jgi:2-C-methyl-D-erythritol 4-phosphate cytidylyltransferase